MTKGQKKRLVELIRCNREVNWVHQPPDYNKHPTMEAIFSYIDSLILVEAAKAVFFERHRSPSSIPIYCTRGDRHEGPCNGFPRNSCPVTGEGNKK